MSEYLQKQDMINIINGHLRELNAEKYSHELRIKEFEASGLDTIDQGLYTQYQTMLGQYDLRIQALEIEKERVLALPE